MTRHILKIEPNWFERLNDGSKNSEVRKHDRDFQIGDAVVFMEVPEFFGGYIPGGTRRCIEATISHILPASVFTPGLKDGYSVLSLRGLSDIYTVKENEQP